MKDPPLQMTVKEYGSMNRDEWEAGRRAGKRSCGSAGTGPGQLWGRRTGLRLLSTLERQGRGLWSTIMGVQKGYGASEY